MSKFYPRFHQVLYQDFIQFVYQRSHQVCLSKISSRFHQVLSKISSSFIKDFIKFVIKFFIKDFIKFVVKDFIKLFFVVVVTIDRTSGKSTFGKVFQAWKEVVSCQSLQNATPTKETAQCRGDGRDDDTRHYYILRDA
jgi:hypothetical protein